MAGHGAREQKRLAKQKAKRHEKRTLLARESSSDPSVVLMLAADWPILAALVPDNLWESGIGHLVFSRRASGGRIAVGVYLVDVFCLGVKNAFWNIVTPGEYDILVDKFTAHGRLSRVEPEYFSKLIHQAADYAQSFGFRPHPDFRNARLMLLGIDPSQCSTEFQFGKNGKPFYVSGPFESSSKAHAIANRVQAAGGEFVIRM